MTNNITKLNQLTIKKFRALENLELPLGNRITVICGKNGTAKSTILGIAAQVFNFKTDYENNTSLEHHKTVYNKSFKSNFSEHFRLSSEYDLPGTMKLSAKVFDGYQNKIISANLELTNHKDRKHRMVVRQLDENSKITCSRNFTHPVIYLNLKRLFPITDRNYEKVDNEYFSIPNNKTLFCNLSSRMLLNYNNKNISSTTGDIDATVAYGQNYDEQSVSVGEDNVGQICSALLSFKKLSEALGKDYKGGLLLIDEADAGLFPAAQKQLVEILNEYSTRYNLQVILTTHSQVIINEVLKLHRKKPLEHQLHYLTLQEGKIKTEENRSWEWIENDLLVQMAPMKKNLFPKVSVFFEDSQALDFFNAITFHSKYNRYLKKNTQASFGCETYKKLATIIPNFDIQLLFVLDGDTPKSKIPSILRLPTKLAPDQLLFWILYNIPESDKYWNNNLQLTKSVFLHNAREILENIIPNNPENLSQDDLKVAINNYQASSKSSKEKKARKLFKSFSKKPEIVSIVKHMKPFKRYLEQHPKEKIAFLKDLENALSYVLEQQLNMTKSEVKNMLGL